MINPQVFRQYDIRGVVGEEINAESYYLIGKGFGSYLRRRDLKTIALGGDARLTTPEMVMEEVDVSCEGNGYTHQAREVMEGIRAGRTESDIMPLDETLEIMGTLDALRALWGVRYPME